jgi:hypothetical protein
MEGAPQYFGEQMIWIEEPDLFCMRFRGTVDPASFRAMLAFQHTWCKDKKHYFVLCDLSGIDAVPLETRRALHDFRKRGSATAACFGASFPVRIMADMVGRARRALGLAPASSLTRFFATEAEARAFIQKERKARSAAI